MAIGRSIIRDTQILLFDEPLSNLDTVRMRMRMRLEIARMCDRLDATMVHVTHDQTEAMTLADRIVVFNHGRIEQIGAPVDLYDASASLFVAGSIGAPAMNFIPAVVESPDGHVKQVRFGVAADEAHARSTAGAGHVRRPPGASVHRARGGGGFPRPRRDRRGARSRVARLSADGILGRSGHHTDLAGAVRPAWRRDAGAGGTRAVPICSGQPGSSCRTSGITMPTSQGISPSVTPLVRPGSDAVWNGSER